MQDLHNDSIGMPEGEGPATPWWTRWRMVLADSLIAERSRWFLWAPVCLAAGSIAYFALRSEPAQWIGLAVVSLLAGLFLLARRLRLRLPLAILLLAAIGFALAQERTIVVASPMLAGPLGPAKITGRVLDVEPTAAGARVTMDRVTSPLLAREFMPAHIHIRLTKNSPIPAAGSVIRLRAVLMPPAGPAEPGAHDFRRDLFFEQVGGVGYAESKPTLVVDATAKPTEARLEKLRQFISSRVIEVLGQTPEAAITIAYMTGERGLIDQATADNMRNSGLAHLLALSGMKVGLVAIIAFAACRLALALVPPLALRISTRKIAAAVGIAMACLYVVLAAAPVPALRSVLMTGMAMTAIMFDRQSFSLRLAAVAACIVIVWQPEAVTGVSFQMSFGAVIALIAFYEAMRLRLANAYRGAGRPRRAMLGVAKLLVTTFIATLVTSPLALFHFQQEANYSIFANAVAIPLNDFWIMPCGIAAMLLMPLGLDRLALLGMGDGVGWMLDIAHAVSRWPGAVTHVPSLPDAALVLLEFGGLWIIVWKGKWRRLGLIGVTAGLIVACFHQTPDVLVAEDGKRIAFHMSDGLLAISKLGRHDFTVDSWNRMNGHKGLAMLPDTGGMDGDRIDCHADACVYLAQPAAPVIWLRNSNAAADWCKPGTIVISEDPIATRCPGATVIDGTSLAGTGAVSLRLVDGTYSIRSAATDSGKRPWSLGWEDQ